MQSRHIYAQPHIQQMRVLAHIGGMAQKARRKTFLREWRLSKPGRTLEQVAAELHISQPQLGRIERGEQPYNQDLIEALAEIYGCDEADLIMRPPGRSREIKLVWDQVPETERDRALAVLEAFIPSSARVG